MSYEKRFTVTPYLKRREYEKDFIIDSNQMKNKNYSIVVAPFILGQRLIKLQKEGETVRKFNTYYPLLTLKKLTEAKEPEQYG